MTSVFSRHVIVLAVNVGGCKSKIIPHPDRFSFTLLEGLVGWCRLLLLDIFVTPSNALASSAADLASTVAC